MKNAIAIATLAVIITAAAAIPAFAQTTDAPRYGFFDMLKAKAEILKMSTDDLQKVLETKTMPEVLEAQNVSQTDFQNRMRETRNARLDARVKAGLLTQEEANTRKAQAEERMKNCDGTGNRQGMGYGNRRGMNR